MTVPPGTFTTCLNLLCGKIKHSVKNSDGTNENSKESNGYDDQNVT